MKEKSEWRRRSKEVITEALLEYEAKALSLGDRFDMKEAFKVVNDRYPFGERENHPYRIWLKTIEEAKELMANQSPSFLVQNNWLEIRSIDPNQLTLFK